MGEDNLLASFPLASTRALRKQEHDPEPDLAKR